MENKEQKTTSDTWVQKDYSKLENIFNAAVERSKQKKIIPYGSKRLYSKQELLKLTAEMFKNSPHALPLEIEDIKTEVVDLENPKTSESKKSFNTEVSSKTEVIDEVNIPTQPGPTEPEPTTTTVNEPRKPIITAPKENEAFDTAPLDAPGTLSLLDRYNELKQKQLSKTQEPVVKTEPKTEVITEEKAQSKKKPDPEFFTTTAAFIASIAAVLIFVFFTYSEFTGYDYIGLIFTVITIFVAWDLSMKRNLILCVVLLVTLIICMIVSVYQTQMPVGFVHYLWFLLIPLCMSTSHAFIISYREYKESSMPA